VRKLTNPERPDATLTRYGRVRAIPAPEDPVVPLKPQIVKDLEIGQNWVGPAPCGFNME